jgi:NAD(P)-dependent dehydrogenase (short-subunit alcohol dehydrogenase family)
MSENADKTIIVTGGAQGIGSIIARDLNLAGFKIIVFDIDLEAIAEKKPEYDNIEYLKVDVSSETEIIDALSKIDCLHLFSVINNAAIHARKPLEELHLDDWKRVLAVNLTGPFLLAKHTSKFLRKNKGSIVNIASTRALMSEANTEAYSASKGGLLSLTHVLAVSLGPEIRVNAISPGWIETGDLKKKSVRRKIEHSAQDKMQHPAGRVGIAEDISAMVKFLISDEAGFITGQNYIVDGGMTRKMIYA